MIGNLSGEGSGFDIDLLLSGNHLFIRMIVKEKATTVKNINGNNKVEVLPCCCSNARKLNIFFFSIDFGASLLGILKYQLYS